MHITLHLNGDNQFLRVPSANLHLFQSLLYKILPPEQAAFLHKEGYPVDGRAMKLFAMSWPISASVPSFEQNTIRFPLPIRLVVSTPVETTFDGFASGALSAETVRVGNNILRCEKIEAIQQYADGDELTVRTLSPVTCYDQVERFGKPYTIYFSPQQKDFGVLLSNNLVRKFKALFPDRTPPDLPVTIEPLGRPVERIARFSSEVSFPIKGWFGRFRLKGPKELLQIALDCGIGAKNSAGWGCVTKVV